MSPFLNTCTTVYTYTQLTYGRTPHSGPGVTDKAVGDGPAAAAHGGGAVAFSEAWVAGMTGPVIVHPGSIAKLHCKGVRGRVWAAPCPGRRGSYASTA